MTTTTPTELFTPSGHRFVLRRGGWHSEDCDTPICAGHRRADADRLYGPLAADRPVQGPHPEEA